MAHRNAASVLPDPVGAMTRVFSPRPMALQAWAWAGVGSAKAAANQALVASLKPASTGPSSGRQAGILPSCLVPPTEPSASLLAGLRRHRVAQPAGAPVLACRWPVIVPRATALPGSSSSGVGGAFR